MKKLIFSLSILLCIGNASAQTYATLPYSTGFESGSLDASWTEEEETSGASNARVQVTTNFVPYAGTYHLTMDETGASSNTVTGAALLHLDLSGQTDVTLEFYLKDFGDENNTGANGDGVFFWDSATSAFIEVFHIDPTTYTNNTWYRIVLDLDVLAAANSIALTDSFIIKFQQRDNASINMLDFTMSDGLAFDNISVFETPPLEAGTISATPDTICENSGGNVNINSVQDAIYGSGAYTYNWEISYNLSSWSSLGSTGATPTRTISAPTQSFFLRRCVNTATEGPVCSNTIFVFVAPKPNVTFSGLLSQYCTNDPISALTGFPSGGIFSGSTGISGSNFNAANAANSVGGTVNNVTYTYTNSYGCTHDTTISTTVRTATIVNFPDNLGTYVDNDLIANTMSATPPGGTFSGPGVINGNQFVPAFSGGVGTKIISYTFTAANGCTDVKTIDAQIVPNSGGTFGGVVNPVCENGSNMNITITVNPGWIPYSDGSCWNQGWYTYCGSPAFAVNSPTSMTFSPSLAGPGYWYIYHYSYDPVCCDYVFSSTVIEVQARPNLNVNNLATSYCINSPQVALTASFSDGSSVNSPVWSGTGMTGNLFIPSNAGVGGPYVISVTATNGVCSNMGTAATTVYGLTPVSVNGFDAQYCKNSPADTIIGSPLGGIFDGNQGILDKSRLDTLVWDASIASTGTRTITYTYTDGNGCTNVGNFNTTVYDIPAVDFTGLQNLFCEDTSIINLTGNPSPTPNGIFTGDNIINNGNGTATFDVGACTVDSTYFIRYTYTDGNGCTNSATKSTFIKSLPVVDFSGLNTQYCVSDAGVLLTPSPNVGSSFSGNGIVGNWFHPSNAGVGLHSITMRHTDVNGCRNDTTKSTTVHDLPVVSFTGLDNEYCEDAELDTLVGNQVGGTFLRVTASPIVNDTAVLDPRTFDVGTHSIIFQYIDGNSCFNADTQLFIINQVTPPSMAGLIDGTNRFCEYNSAINLTGSVNLHPTPIVSSFFFGSGITNTGPFTASFDPTQVPLYGNTVNVDSVSFVYFDNKGCTDTVVRLVTVHARPIVNFVTIDPDDGDSIVCENLNLIFLSPSPPSSGLGTGVFSGSVGVSSGTDFFRPSNAETGVNNITYTYTDEYNCINSITKPFVVLPLPEPNFVLGSLCNDDTIQFTDLSIIPPFEIAGTNPDFITNWYWSFGDGGTDSIYQHPRHKYIIPTTYSVSLTTLTDNGCRNTVSIPVKIGQPPVAVFEWDNICFGETLQFTDLSTATLSDPIATYNWDFGDLNTSAISDPTHQYAALGTYDVMLALATGQDCRDTLIKTINIRPVVDAYPYFENFETSNGYWFASGQTNGVEDSTSWQIGVANKTVINDVSTGNISWVTNLTGNHYNNEQSYVDGPCFDFTNLVKPMIRMNIWSDLLEGSDGVVLQYTLDNGETWTNIGIIGDGINWYNRASINGNPGDQSIGQLGWSFQGDNRWIEVRHDLDALAGEPQVRFRVAFGSDGAGNNNGFAFDDVWIGERSRIALVEHFTNSADANSFEADRHIDSLVYRNRRDLVDIQYHTNFPGNDVMNQHNPSDPSARTLYYGAFNTARSVLNGNVYNGITTAINDNMVKLQVLRDSPFELMVGHEINGTEFTATAYMTSKTDFNNIDVTLHLAVVEKVITAITGDNGDTEFRSVLKKMLPAASGTLYVGSWEEGIQKGIEKKWSIENVFDNSRLHVVAFLQDNITKEIYQVATSDTTGSVPPLSVKKNTSENLKMKLFPNPNNGQITILFNQNISDAKIEIIDQYGRLLDVLIPADNIEYIGLELPYSAGIYMIRVSTPEGVSTQKMIITK